MNIVAHSNRGELHSLPERFSVSPYFSFRVYFKCSHSSVVLIILMLDFYDLNVIPLMTLNAFPTHIYSIYSLAAFQITRSGKRYCMLTGQWVGVIMICIHASKGHSQLKLNRCVSISVNFVCSLQRLYNEIKIIKLSVYCISSF